MQAFTGKNGVYLIAEIGGNHEGDLSYARELMNLACHSGVDAVKLQIYTGDTLVSKIENPQGNAHFKRFELRPEEYISLAEQCIDSGVTFTASVWDDNALDWIDPYIQFYKVGSGDLTAYPLLKKIAAKEKPIILSTGLAILDEIRATINFLQSLDDRYKSKEYLALLQCTAMYPIPDEEANLQVIELFKDEFQLTVGYSDHTIGTDAVEIAVALGAEIVEMHFTDTREGKSFRDHQISFTCQEIQELIIKIMKINRLRGQRIKKPTKSEMDAEHLTIFRRAVYPICDLPAGSLLTEENTTILRPNRGIDARDYAELIGKTLKNDIKAFQEIKSNDICLYYGALGDVRHFKTKV